MTVSSVLPEIIRNKWAQREEWLTEKGKWNGKSYENQLKGHLCMHYMRKSSIMKTKICLKFQMFHESVDTRMVLFAAIIVFAPGRSR